MTLPTAIVYIAMSLDGYIATPEGGLGWLEAMNTPGEDYGYGEFMSSIDALVMGRNTHDVVRAFGEWPFEGKRVVVMTSRDFEPVSDERASSGSLSATFERLGMEGAKRIYLDGGNVIRRGLKEGLVREIVVSIIPTLLGGGISLFEGLGTAVRLENISAKRFPSGLVQLTYRVL